MKDNYFYLKKFSIRQNHAVLKIGTDSILLGSIIEPGDAKEILDIGTGTGILALMMAQKSNAKIDAIDIDTESSKDAIHNFQSSQWCNNINFYLQTIQQYSLECSKKYDLIICNPPYFQNSLLSPFENKNRARHSTTLSIDELFESSIRILAKEGIFAVICPENISEILIKSAKSHGLLVEKQIWIKPNHNKAVNRTIIVFRRNVYLECFKTIIIENSVRHSYTESYKELVKDFLLKF